MKKLNSESRRHRLFGLTPWIVIACIFSYHDAVAGLDLPGPGDHAHRPRPLDDRRRPRREDRGAMSDADSSRSATCASASTPAAPPSSAVVGAALDAARGEVVGVVGESGSRQVADPARDRRPAAARRAYRGGEIEVAGDATLRAPPRSSCGSCAASDRHGLPGADDGAQPGDAGRRPDRRGPAPAPRPDRAARRGAGARAARRVGFTDAERRARVPARALRRHAPAGDDRDRAGRRAAAAALRRADDCARRHDPGPDPGPARRACARELGMAIVLVTHDLGVVAQTCDRIVVMYAGRIVEEGPVAEVFAARATPTRWRCCARCPTSASVARDLE